MEKHDIFISYRRDGGEAMAVLLRDRLTAMEYNVFLDIDGLNSGKFPQKLYGEIRECKDFIVICSKGSFDRCKNEGDWLRIEIAHALKCEKNIIPLIMRGFEFPSDLPYDIKEISEQNGVVADRSEYFDAAFERLAKKFLISKPAKELVLSGVSPGSLNPAPSVVTEETEIIHSYSVGDIITFGDYDWRVLDVKDGKALIITEDIIEKRRFDSSSKKWDSCVLKEYLNNEFINKFNKAQINGDIFLLSIDEVNKYFKNDKERIAKLEGEPYWWWLRSPGPIGANCAAYVCADGSVRVFGRCVDNDYGGVRPALWLKLSD